MAQPDLQCPHCGHSFRNLFDIGEGSTLILDDCQFGCPNCGQVSNGGGQGVYVTVKGVLERIATEIPDREALETLARILRSQAATATPETLTAAVAAEAPTMLPMLDIGGLPPKQWAIFIAALLAALAQLLTFAEKVTSGEALKAAGLAVIAALAAKKPKDTTEAAAYKGTMAALEDDRRRRNEKKRARRARRRG